MLILLVVLVATLPPVALVVGLQLGYRLARLESPVPSVRDLRTSLAKPPEEPDPHALSQEEQDERNSMPKMFMRTGEAIESNEAPSGKWVDEGEFKRVVGEFARSNRE